MQKRIWIFARRHQVLRVERCDAPPGLTVVGPHGERREFAGHSDSELGGIQSRLEEQLRHEGWTLERFTAERRQHAGDRRATARERADRRRS